MLGPGDPAAINSAPMKRVRAAISTVVPIFELVSSIGLTARATQVTMAFRAQIAKTYAECSLPKVIRMSAPDTTSPAARLCAALISLVATLAVGVHWLFVHEAAGTLAGAWAMLRFFTILTNLLVAIVFARIALGRALPAGPLAGVLLAILVVGLVYHGLLAPPEPLPGLSFWTDLGFHTLVPIGVALWWLLWGGRGLRLTQVPYWLIWPSAYSAYALVRGQFDGIYPYFFLDIGTQGVGGVALYGLGLLVGFALLGAVIVGVSRVVPRLTEA